MIEYHKPVMYAECIEALQIKDNAIVIDATLGGGGHTEGILRANPTVKVYAFDQDPDALKFAKKRLEEFEDRVVFIESNFSNLRTQLALHKVNRIDGILFDLGVSSHQLDDAERGFSFSKESPLDMRMDKARDLTASVILNTYKHGDLIRIFRDYGEEKAAKKVASLIVNNRDKINYQTSLDLNNLLNDNMKMNPKFFIKMLSRLYQALRIEVNQEMEVLNAVLLDAVHLLAPQGRIVIESYHSLEDKIVKRFFVNQASTCSCPSSFPVCCCDVVAKLKIITKKPLTATPEELQINSRSRSCKLRIAEKLNTKEK